ncbi:hypothetical protein CYMTET_36832 [Cymbomonas tetramitiformis]|uniref:gamma-glutamylcyclotransferase n=1 Tax=Cymbomonas tetramitiformis TaxID=36881 RepID=A0AAE0CGF4_9CHLO|nr:hypothetical protein CYMTET_46439 [Cymbomonas tetramitiformis]KAK3253938.1 hypothetical protein CYMTET_36832 [Cymbomonas tetramitiformis]|eukprot:gene18528-22116_t
MGQEFLRTKKGLKPLEFAQSVLRGFELSFPEGKGIDWVEPSFATMKRRAGGIVHGVTTLFSIEDAEKLNEQEGVGRAYNIEVCKVLLYDGKTEIDAEVYVATKPLPEDHPEGCCSVRYRDILVNGAKEVSLDSAWIEKLQQLPTYTPSEETLARRAALPPPSALPTMSIAELALHNGQTEEEYPVYSSSCGYIFQHKEFFKAFWGRDVTFRNVLQSRGVNLDSNDDGGKSPFPRLSQLEPSGLEYALQYRDRFIGKTGGPIAVLKEFWEEQEEGVAGIFSCNTLSLLK